jgi:hypothetical protein
MNGEPGYEAFLHIVHVSDIHCRIGSSPTDRKTERLVQWAAEQIAPFSEDAAQFVRAYYAEGLAGHDPRAHRRFCEFLKTFVEDRDFAGIETWLLDTGDLSSMGDIGSIHRVLEWHKTYRSILDPKYSLTLYGNHDAWPGRFPAKAPTGVLEAHRTQLRAGPFPNKWPLAPIETAIPGTESKVQLFSLNSVIHDRWWNTFARGHVGNDLHWDATSAQDQLAILEYQASQGGLRNFRILAVHHPVHYPERPEYVMSLRNDEAVADALISFEESGLGKLAHLVLSGHTHFAFPAFGELESAMHPPNSPLIPLTDGQLQLITGSLAQMPSERARAKVPPDRYIPHQCEILTFWAAPDEPDNLLLERRIVGRPGGSGDYDFIDVGDEDEPKFVESVVLQY